MPVIRAELVGPDGRARAVVVKEVTGANAHRRRAHEVAILRRLAGVAGVPTLVEGRPETTGDDEASIVLEDLGGVAADHARLPLEPEALVEVALGLARVVAGVHARGVVHHDINPGNVVLAERVALVDYELATTSAEERPGFAHPTEIPGTLAYLAPEQTGRTGRPVDQRADLYALGATLYELATGRPPFGAGDPLRLTYDHLARVPRPPAVVAPGVPADLSRVIQRLLEKEPDRRYQSAAGLVHDLSVIAGRMASQSDVDSEPLVLGERDFPDRLRPPSRLIGRDHERDVMARTLRAAVAGPGRVLLVSGGSGVGKSALIDELRPMVAGLGGWFVAGKFDEHRRDPDFDAVRQAYRALGRLLLAEPERELAAARERLLSTLGLNAGLVVSVVPEFAPILGVAPEDIGDPLKAQDRLASTAVDLARVLVSPQRPLVLMVDDLQWSWPTPLGLFDAVAAGDGLAGLLVVGVFRDDDLPSDHPLSALLSRWQRTGTSPTRIRLGNLPRGDLAALLSDMLRLDGASGPDLATILADRTGGNPFDTVELVNAMRRDGALRLDDAGWQWDGPTLRRYLGRTDVADLLHARVDALPADTRALLVVMAGLGGRVDLDLLASAAGFDQTETEQRLAPALDEGLLIFTAEGVELVRFRHDRVQAAVSSTVDEAERARTGLATARRLAARPEHHIVAADQYLPVVAALTEPGERRHVAELLREAADHARLLGNHMAVDHLLATALDLMDEAGADRLVPVLTERHAALCSLGRFAEGDRVYRRITGLTADPLALAEATCAQISSLTSQGQPAAAVALGSDLLGRLGLPRPPVDATVDAEIEAGLDTLDRWLAHGDAGTDLARPDIDDPALLAAAAVTNHMLPAAFFSDQRVMQWLTTTAVRLWVEHGPAGALVGPIAHIAFVTTQRREDRRSGERAMHRLIAVGAARGYEPETSQARFLYALGTGHWYAPLEENLRLVTLARDRLIQGGDLPNACHTLYVTASQLFDCAPTLDAYLAEIDASLALAGRAGDDLLGHSLRAHRDVARRLRAAGDAGADDAGAGDGADDAGAGDGADDGRTGIATTDGNVAVVRSIGAAVLDDRPALARHSAAAMARLPFFVATYATVIAHTLRSLALAQAARDHGGARREAELAQARASRDWLAARAADRPGSYRHLVLLVEAEIAWTDGDHAAAAEAFDAALVALSAGDLDPTRPWHRALTAEHAAEFYTDRGLGHVGRALRREARLAYQAWGAGAKVAQLAARFPETTQETGPDAGAADEAPGAPIAIDLLAVLDASRALSSETDRDRLVARVVDVLSAMTGATSVRLLLRDEAAAGWVLRSADGPDLPLDEAGERGLVALSPVRYAERTREPLLVKDAVRDDRFARDPYLRGVDRCSIMIVPILVRGESRAMLLLENRLIHGAFSSDRLDAVILIAGQLAVSLDNATLYASLERKVAERTEALAVANRRLETLSNTDPLTGLANRRRWEEALAAQWRRSARTGRPMGVAMVDIDHFKSYNDHYGHLAGDGCLARIASTLRAHVRESDLVARYGGEEFAVVMADVDPATAAGLAERLRVAVEALAEPHELAAPQRVTVSIGVVALVPGSGPAGQLVEAADAELYEAKDSGRNRVSAAGMRQGT